MAELNPYAPPASDLVAAIAVAPYGFWREGATLVVSRAGSQLPDRCVHCNDPAAGYRLKRKVYWHHPLIYVLLISPILYVIVGLLARKSIRLEIGLCDKHRARRRLGLGLVFGGLLSPFALGMLSTSSRLGETFVPLILVAALVGILAGAILLRGLAAKRIDEHYAWLKVGASFLASIPNAPRG